MPRASGSRGKGKKRPVKELEEEVEVKVQKEEEEEEAGTSKGIKSSPKKGKRLKQDKGKKPVQEEVSEEEEEEAGGDGPSTGGAASTSGSGSDKTIPLEKDMRIVSWNINGIRAWVKNKGQGVLLRDLAADMYCLQETKCSEKKLPPETKAFGGYHKYYNNPEEKEGYAGVALFSKQKPLVVTYGMGIEEHDIEGRSITAEFDKFYLVNVYVPNSGRGLVRLKYRQQWDVDFRGYLKGLKEKKPVIVCGDMNVAHKEIDIANPKTNQKNAGFTPEEREGFSVLLKEGFVDSFRHLYPKKKDVYTFWTYMSNARAKNIGWRLDYFLLSPDLVGKLRDCQIKDKITGSDHCPLVLYLKAD